MGSRVRPQSGGDRRWQRTARHPARCRAVAGPSPTLATTADPLLGRGATMRRRQTGAWRAPRTAVRSGPPSKWGTPDSSASPSPGSAPTASRRQGWDGDTSIASPTTAGSTGWRRQPGRWADRWPVPWSARARPDGPTSCPVWPGPTAPGTPRLWGHGGGARRHVGSDAERTASHRDRRPDLDHDPVH